MSSAVNKLSDPGEKGFSKVSMHYLSVILIFPWEKSRVLFAQTRI